MPTATNQTESAPLTEQTQGQVITGGESVELAKVAATSGAFYRKVRLMRKHPTVKLARALAIAPLLASQWSIESKDGAPPDGKDFIHDCVMPLRMHLLKTSLYGCVDFGWQPYEKVFKLNELGAFAGKIVPAKVKPLLQDKTKILVDPANGSFAGLLNETAIKVELGIPESLLVNFDVEGTNWYGTSDMEAVEGPYDEWNITNTANVRYDKKIAGAHWVIHYPPGKSPFNGVDTDNYEIARNLLVTLETSGSFVVPRTLQNFVDDLNKDQPAWIIELKSTYPTSGAAFIERLNYIDKLLVRAFGLPERAVLEGQFGTKAEAEAHADFAITNMELRHQIMVQQYNWHLVNQLLRLNYGPETENTVWIAVAPITDLALQYLRKIYEVFLSNIEGFAQEADSIDMAALRDKLGIPTISDEQRAGADETEARNGMRRMVDDLLPAAE